MTPQPPDWYTPEQHTIWTQLREEILNTTPTTHINQDRLTALIGHITRYRRAQQLLNTTDILINRDGTPIPNPALAILKDEEQSIQRLRREFGLTRKSLPPLELKTPKNPQAQGRWCDQHGRHECTAHRQRDGALCHSTTVKHMPRCAKHLGLARNNPIIVLAQERRANPLAGEPMDITPMQALIWRVRVLAGEVSRLDLRIAELSEDDLVFGVTRVDEKQDYSDSPERVTTREAKLNMWLLLRDQRERMLHNACEAALRAGIQEQVVDLLKQEAVVLARVMIKVLDLFGIGEDDERIPQIMPFVVRELAA